MPVDLPEDRRRSRRYTLNLPARVWVGGEERSGTLRDLSEAGVYFSAGLDGEVAAGAPAYLSFQIDGAVAEAVGEVVRTCPFGTELGVGIGLRLGNDALADLLERLGAARSWERAGVLAAIRELAIRVG